jgi:hypothetical protein
MRLNDQATFMDRQAPKALPAGFGASTPKTTKKR